MSNLVITRRPGESFLIGPDIVVKIVAIAGQQTRISITAPREVTILREELISFPKEPANARR
jgi:carbon storage regulator